MFAVQSECLSETQKTREDIDKLEDNKLRVDFRKTRMDYVTSLLNEFNSLDPSALDTIFEYKQSDEKEQMDEFWDEKRRKQSPWLRKEYE